MQSHTIPSKRRATDESGPQLTEESPHKSNAVAEDEVYDWDGLVTFMQTQDQEAQDEILLEELRGWDVATLALLEGLICFEDYVFASEAPPKSKAADEVNVKTLSKEMQSQFRTADCKEWTAILGSGAVRVLDPQAAHPLAQARFAYNKKGNDVLTGTAPFQSVRTHISTHICLPI